MMPDRPHRDEIEAEGVDGDILLEVRMLAWEFHKYRAEVNGDLRWLNTFRKMSGDISRLLMVAVPVLLAAALALHLSR